MRRVLATMTCLAAAITVVGCGGGSSPLSGAGTGSKAPTTTADIPAARTADPPVEFDADAGVPLPAKSFSTNVAGSVTTKFLTLRDRTEYIVGPTGMTSVDVLTGKQKWVSPIEGTPADPNNQSGPFVNTTGPRPPVVTDKLAVAAVPVAMPDQGTTPGYIVLTVLAADVHTGKKVWQVSTKVSDDEFDDATDAVTSVVAVTDKAVVATYTHDDSIEAKHITVALDPATGKTLWSKSDYSGGSVNGDTLVGVDYSQPNDEHYELKATALDIATGQQKWVAAQQSKDVAIVPADPATVVIDRVDSDTEDGFLLFLDPATGAEKAKLTTPGDYATTSYGDCYYDEQSVLICYSNGVLTGYEAATARTLWSLPDKAANRIAPDVTVAWHGALYGTAGSGAIVLDAKTGKDLSTKVGVVPYWVSKYVAIGVGDDNAPMAYPVKK